MELFEIVKETLADLTAKEVDYHSLHFTYNNEKFCIGYGMRNHEVNVWADDGYTSLYREEGITSVYDVSQIIVDVINDWMNDYICCSDCGTKIKKSEIAGRYFAGRFCSNCWNGKWREIEAKETYN